MIHVLLEGPTGDDEEIVLTGGAAHHVGRVLRARAGEPVTASDGAGVMARGVIEEVTADRAVLRVEHREWVPLPLFRIRVLLPLLSGVRTAWAVEKIVEAGASVVTPVVTRRGSRQPSRPDHLRARLVSIARAASEQSRRAHLPVIEDVRSLEDGLATGSGEIVVAADTVDAMPVSEALVGLSGPGVALVTGPEGGFDDAERDLLERRGALRVTLGPHVLRAETAPLILLSVVAYAVGVLDALPGEG